MSYCSIGEVPIPSVDPYSEIVQVSVDQVPMDKVKCPVCGSPHGTVFSKILTLEKDKDIISGDLSIRNMVMVRCLSCGHSGPTRFIMIRNM
jgi:hypothetical protein